jgi:glucokinase
LSVAESAEYNWVTFEGACETTMNDTYAVMDVGGSHVAAALVRVDDRAAEIVELHDVPLDPTASAEDLIGTIGSAGLAIPGGNDRGWTIAMPGPFDFETGIGSFEGVGKFAALAGVDLRIALSGNMGTRADSIFFVNDADAYAVGEWFIGAGARARRVICITLGTGVGSGFVDAGSPVSAGPDVPLDGEAHFLEYDGLPLEETVSTRAILAAYKKEHPGFDETVREIAGLAREGDESANGIFTGAMRALGVTLAPWLTRFDADRLVVGGSMARSWDLVHPSLVEGIRSVDAAPRASVVPGALGGHAPLIGAARLASQR